MSPAPNASNAAETPPARRSFTFVVTRMPFSDFFTIHLVDPHTGKPNGQTEELDVDETYEWFRVRGADMKTLEKALDHTWNFYRAAFEITDYRDPPIKNPLLHPRID